MYQARFVSTPVAGALCQHASSLIALQSGDLLCAWYVATEEKNPDEAIYLSRLRPGQMDWEPMRLLLSAERALGNPVLYQHVDGRLWLIYVEMVRPLDWEKCRIHAIYSNDDGDSWSEPRTLVDFLGLMPRNHPLCLRDGSIVLPLYDERKARSVFLISDDGGDTWQLGGDIISTPGNEQAALAQLDDGVLLACMRVRGTPRRILQSRSSNGGWDWSPAELTPFPNPDAGIDLIRLPNGHIVLAFNDSGLERRPLSLALSIDEGASWCAVAHLEVGDPQAGATAPRVIAPVGPNAYDYPSLAVDRAGLLQISYSYRPERRIKHVSIDETWIRAHSVRNHA